MTFPPPLEGVYENTPTGELIRRLRDWSKRRRHHAHPSKNNSGQLMDGAELLSEVADRLAFTESSEA